MNDEINVTDLYIFGRYEKICEPAKMLGSTVYMYLRYACIENFRAQEKPTTHLYIALKYSNLCKIKKVTNLYKFVHVCVIILK